MFRVLPLLLLAGLMVLVALALAGGSRASRPLDPRHHRPRRGGGAAGRAWDAAAWGGAAGPTAGSQAATDFVTGAALDPAHGIVRCDDCRALYHPDTAALLADHNAGRCASCGGTRLRRLTEAEVRRAAQGAEPPERDRALVPEPDTPEAYARALGRLVTVRGTVVGRTGPRGGWPQLLLRDERGTAFRVVLVGDDARGLRGRALADGLIGSRVRLRGLLLPDEAHGLRLLVPDPSMILEASG